MSLVLKINNGVKTVTVGFFNDFAFSLKHDSIGSTFGFNFYFNPLNPDHKAIANGSSFNKVSMYYNDELLLTGVLTNREFKQGSVKALSSFGGYSSPGVLGDCQIPTNLYPLQSDGLNLKEIATKLLKPFNIEMVVDGTVMSKMTKSFKTTTASSTDTIKDYLTELASQKDIIITHDNKGRVLFTEAKTESAPILDYDLTEETPSGVEFVLNQDGQNMHSQITLQKQADIDGGNSGEETVENPYVQNYFKPKVKKQTSGDDIETKTAARRELGNELKSISLTITMDKWDVDGKLLKPNNTITLIAPELCLYKKTTWFIESIDFKGGTTDDTAVLNCVLPEVYNSKTVKSIFI